MRRHRVVAVPRSARRNLDLALDKGVWGFPQGPPTMRQARLQEYSQLARDDSVLITFGYTGSPLESAQVHRPRTTGLVDEKRLEKWIHDLRATDIGPMPSTWDQLQARIRNDIHDALNVLDGDGFV